MVIWGLGCGGWGSGFGIRAWSVELWALDVGIM